MRVTIDTWSGRREMPLARALTPGSYVDPGTGSVEQANDKADKALEVLGDLLAKLVDRRVLTIQEASAVSGNYYDITPIEGDDD